ncbi:DUF3021 domain-containing protein [Jeotgalibacillus sp. JSM ZJ347]|uniref:DUF3021 domain-containing protein n=1 Tax=Jeotgalibacillus sp. JSM ZJ347 TaxID=3342117 RepID=UPI0035A819D3
MSNIILRIFGGFGVGAVFTLVVLLVAFEGSDQIGATAMTLNLLGSMITGAYFSVAALIFSIEHWSMLKQTIIHYSLSLVLMFPVFTLLTGWFPFNARALMIGFAVFTVTYILNWFGWHSYYKRLEKKMNDSIQTRR